VQTVYHPNKITNIEGAGENIAEVERPGDNNWKIKKYATRILKFFIKGWALDL
jgi:hypothetical protein